MTDDSRRAELLQEHAKAVDILQSYDAYFLTIKNWAVTVVGAALTVGVTKASTDVFLVAAILTVGFWLTEVRFKLLQLGHTRRAGELEVALQTGQVIPGPRLLMAFGEESAVNYVTRRWRKVMFWPQVMFPHAVFLVLSLLAALWSLPSHL